MTDPYTRDDLIAEAARQHKTLTEGPDFMGIGEAMDSAPIPSRPADDWDDLPENDFAAAHSAIDDLINRAANTSEWAIALGADGLEPHPGFLDLGHSGQPPQVRIHFAFSADMAEDARADLIAQIGAFTIHGLT